MCIVLAASTLIRPDALVFASLILLYLGWAEPRNLRLHVLGGGLVLTGVVAAQLVFRWHYFGDLLPNTYYLKLTGYPLLPRLCRGMAVTIVFLVLLTPLIALAAGARRCAAFPLASILFCGQLLYSIYVGGDAWEWWGGSNRYLTPVMPLFLIMFASGAATLAERHATTPTRVSPSRPRFRLIALVAVGLAVSNAPQMRSFLFITRPLQTDENAQKVAQALLVKALTDSEARIAVVWAGAIPYFSERHSIDLLGKTDARVAHERMHVPENAVQKWLGFWPGHLKWDYDYSVGQLKPDIVLELWGTKPDEIPALNRNYVLARVCDFTWHVRSDSAHVRWDMLRSGSVCQGDRPLRD